MFKSSHYPGQLVATRRGSPLLVGIKSHQSIVTDHIPVIFKDKKGGDEGRGGEERGGDRGEGRREGRCWEMGREGRGRKVKRRERGGGKGEESEVLGVGGGKGGEGEGKSC